MKTRSVAVLTSGGVDSAVLVAEALKRPGSVHPVYVACGLAWERAELHWLRRYLHALKARALRPLTVLQAPAAPLYGAHWSLGRKKAPGYRSADSAVYLPGRNLLLLSQAAVFCATRRLPEVWLGTLSGNPFSDSRAAFIRALEAAVAVGLGFRLRVKRPFAALGKDDVVRRGKGLPLRLTFSCLSPRGLKPCGSCNKCAERDRAIGSAAGERPLARIQI